MSGHTYDKNGEAQNIEKKSKNPEKDQKTHNGRAQKKQNKQSRLDKPWKNTKIFEPMLSRTKASKHESKLINAIIRIA